MIRREIHIFFAALMFFTRIPCPKWVEYSQASLNKASRYLPLVGWIVGTVGALVLWMAHLVLPYSLAMVLSLIAAVLLTGAFHEDGFADVCDGFGGGWTAEDVLTIMKDSRVGAFGVIGIVLLLALKLASLTSLPLSLAMPGLVAGHSLSRFAAISLLYTHDYARQDAQSKSKPLVRRISILELGVAGLFGMAPMLFLGLAGVHVWKIGVCVSGVWIAQWYAGYYLRRRLGGYTGDCLGAVQQITEVIFYLTLVGLSWKSI